MLKAIETVYKGYRFRSRLEARWAVFFDTLGIKWEYEKEGYDLGDDVLYLPDFFLPDLHHWVEIKGQPLTEKELEKAQRLVRQSGFNVVAFCGEIEIPTMGVLIESKGTSSDTTWQECPLCKKVCLWHTNFCTCLRPLSDAIGNLGLEMYSNHRNHDYAHWLQEKAWEFFRQLNDTPRLVKAYTAARQARFEFGEQGTKEKKEKPPKVNPSQPRSDIEILQRWEEYIIAMLLLFPDLAIETGWILSPMPFHDSKLQSLFQLLLKDALDGVPGRYLSSGDQSDLGMFAQELKQETEKKHAQLGPYKPDVAKRAITQTAYRTKKMWLRGELSKCISLLIEAERDGDQERVYALEHQLQELNQTIRAIDLGMPLHE